MMAEGRVAIEYGKKYATRNEEIVAQLRASAGAAPPIDYRMRVKRLAAETATLMALIHGGDWRVQVDHDVGLIVVARRGRRRTR